MSICIFYAPYITCNIIVILGKMFIKYPIFLTHVVSNIWEQCTSQVYTFAIDVNFNYKIDLF
jgi:hypothetical protein